MTERLVNVLDFPIERPLTDVVGRLRHLADRIEAGEQEALVAVVVLVGSDGEPQVLGFGDIGRSVEAVGWLARALRAPI